MTAYLWHGKPCKVLYKAPFLKGIKRNAAIQFTDGAKLVVPWRSLRRDKSSKEVNDG